jgi:cysteine-rich repeat protein
MRTVCRQGMREGSEACDDGNLIDADGCSHTCSVEDGYGCVSACSALFCGITAPSVCRYVLCLMPYAFCLLPYVYGCVSACSALFCGITAPSALRLQSCVRRRAQSWRGGVRRRLFVCLKLSYALCLMPYALCLLSAALSAATRAELARRSATTATCCTMMAVPPSAASRSGAYLHRADVKAISRLY